MSVAGVLGSNNRIDAMYLPAPYNLAYGSFSSSQTQRQTGNVANTPTVITYNTVEIVKDIALVPGSPSQIRVSNTGVYKLLYSIQLDKTGGGNSTCDIWIRKNGNNVPRSAGQVVVAGQNGETLPCVEYLLQLNANDFVEVVFSSPDSTMGVTAFPENVVVGIPAIPSIITNIIQIA
jgi:hypothetical protein